MSSTTKSFPDGPGKGYSPPYPGHKAMQCDKQPGKGSSQFVGTKKVTTGKKSNLVSGGKKGD